MLCPKTSAPDRIEKRRHNDFSRVIERAVLELESPRFHVVMLTLTLDADATVDDAVRLMCGIQQEKGGFRISRWLSRSQPEKRMRPIIAGKFIGEVSFAIGRTTWTPGLLLLARLHGRPIGCGPLKFHQRRPAELKRMSIAPAARGAGVARRLLGELERSAREAGAVVLDLRQTEYTARQSHFTNVQVLSKLRRSTPNPMPTTGSKKRLGRSGKVQ
jgi:GNAT superfamily N-acetyltransferase